MAVGNRTNSFVHLARFIAAFPEYTKALLDHLVDAKVGHWDPQIRELSAASLAALTEVAPQYLIQVGSSVFYGFCNENIYFVLQRF